MKAINHQFQLRLPIAKCQQRWNDHPDDVSDEQAHVFVHCAEAAEDIEYASNELPYRRADVSLKCVERHLAKSRVQ